MLCFRGRGEFTTIGHGRSYALQSFPPSTLAEALRRVGWPRKIEASQWDSASMEALSHALDDYIVFASLCEDANITARAVAVMLKPLRVRFAFHFDTDRPTNRLDKPEWFLTHLLQALEMHLPLLTGYLELEDVTTDNKEGAVGEGGGASVTRTFVEGLGQLVVEHLDRRRPPILADPFILLHTVSEVGKFVQRVREISGVDLGELVTGQLLAGGGLFEAWLEAEDASCHEALGSLLGKGDGSGWEAGEGGELTGPDSVGGTMVRFCELVEEAVMTMSALPRLAWKLDYLDRAIVPLFDALRRNLEFAIPAFHGTPEDVKTLILQANSLHLLTERLRSRWGEAEDALELARSTDFCARYSYDASELPGTIYHKLYRAFKTLLGEIAAKLQAFVWQAFSQPANSFVRAMHYAVYRGEGQRALRMHDDLRRALIAVSEAHAQLCPFLHPKLLRSIEGALLESLATFLFERMIGQNFFRRENLAQVRDDLQQIQTTFSRIMDPQLVELAMRRSRESVKLQSMGLDEQEHLLEALRRDELEEVSDILSTLAITALSIRDCETVLSLIRD